MSISDPIADALTMIRNALKAKKETVDIPNSKVINSIAQLLKQEGYLENVKLLQENKQGTLRLYLKYVYGKPAIKNLKRISRPGLRSYRKSKDIRKVLGGLGLSIISTSQGIMTDKEARLKKIGGEIICNIW